MLRKPLLFVSPPKREEGELTIIFFFLRREDFFKSTTKYCLGLNVPPCLTRRGDIEKSFIIEYEYFFTPQWQGFGLIEGVRE